MGRNGGRGGKRGAGRVKGEGLRVGGWQERDKGKGEVGKRGGR